jgi:RNA polymerase sigma factor (sigma-70 family)
MARDVEYVAFVEANGERYLRLARLLTGDRDRGEELLQDSLVRLYVRWRRAAITGDVHAYLRRMLVNGNISWWRRRRREHLVEAPPDHADPAGAGHEPHDELRRALLWLPYRQRAVVVLRHFEDLSERTLPPSWAARSAPSRAKTRGPSASSASCWTTRRRRCWTTRRRR